MKSSSPELNMLQQPYEDRDTSSRSPSCSTPSPSMWVKETSDIQALSVWATLPDGERRKELSFFLTRLQIQEQIMLFYFMPLSFGVVCYSHSHWNISTDDLCYFSICCHRTREYQSQALTPSFPYTKTMVFFSFYMNQYVSFQLQTPDYLFPHCDVYHTTVLTASCWYQ